MTRVIEASRRRWAPLLAPPLLLLFLSWKPASVGPTICPFAIATGHACPLCGGTRAAAALLDGDVASAWALHPMVFMLAPLALTGWVAWLGTTRGWWNPPSPTVMNRLTLGLGVAALAVWIARATTGSLPPV
jgi:hypothetical protein